MKKLIWIILFLLTFGAGLWIAQMKWMPWSERQIQEQNSVLLEKVKQVAKLITVEGYFSEIYDYKDYYGYDWRIFRKKALIRVKAKVSVGYDLGQMKYTSHPDQKKIIISALPMPNIIAIDHDLDYYDISEGTFNTFSKEDYNHLNAQAKSYIEKVALESGLLKQAEKQGMEFLLTIRFLVEGSGWTLEIKENPAMLD
jgi:hypothetical protein